MSNFNLEEYHHGFIPIESKETPTAFLARHGFSSNAYRHIVDEINTFLDTTNLSSSNRNGIIIFPIYWKKLNLDSDEQITYLTKFELHCSLLINSEISVCRLKNGVVTGRIDTNNLRQHEYDDMKAFYVSNGDVKLQPEDILRIELNLYHKSVLEL